MDIEKVKILELVDSSMSKSDIDTNSDLEIVDIVKHDLVLSTYDVLEIKGRVCDEDSIMEGYGNLHKFYNDYTVSKKISKVKKRKKKKAKRDKEFEMVDKKRYEDYSRMLDIFNPQLLISQHSEHFDNSVPESMMLHCQNSGFFFGINRAFGPRFYVGKPQGDDGHVLIAGGTGSGKSSGIAKPSLKTWRGPIFAIDIKGELTEFYYNIKSTKRPVKVLNLIGEEEPLFT